MSEYQRLITDPESMQDITSCKNKLQFKVVKYSVKKYHTRSLQGSKTHFVENTLRKLAKQKLLCHVFYVTTLRFSNFTHSYSVYF